MSKIVVGKEEHISFRFVDKDMCTEKVYVKARKGIQESKVRRKMVP